jgi:hypothetical protein
MKTLLVLIFIAVGVQAAETAKSDAKSSQTNHSFEDLLVQGKYHFTDEAVSTVEEDKVLDALLGVRADFKDRMQKSAEQF